MQTLDEQAAGLQVAVSRDGDHSQWRRCRMEDTSRSKRRLNVTGLMYDQTADVLFPAEVT